MELKVLEKSSSVLKFLIKDINSVVANTLRRAMMNEIPILAIKEVTFTKNTSALFDEVLAHRLGLLPLKTNLDNFTDPETCSCKGKGCGKCQVTFTINCEGPLTIYADSLKCGDDGVKQVYGKIPIVKLLKGQELEFEAVATLGKDLNHAKYSPCLAYYQGEPQIKVENVKNVEEVVKSCPQEVLEADGKKVKVKDLMKCDLCGACEEASEGGVVVDPSESSFIFTIESWGQLEPKEIYEKALIILNKKLDGFGSLLSKVK